MNNDNQLTELLGKKIFFLYPSAVIQNRIISELIQQEYEVYIVRDHVALRKVLQRYPHSVVFADIDEQMSERNWEALIRGIMSAPETQTTAIGIISANDDEALQRKYINLVKIQCGYTVLRADLGVSIKQICDVLGAVDAKGRRKYIRAITEAGSVTTVNLPMNGTFINGIIKDISVVGLSCTFNTDPELEKNTLFRDIQIKLNSMILKVEGIIFGSRMDGQSKIYVLLFTQRIDPEVRTKIRKYMQQNL
ncbi:MAG: pilus assembly protein PilZ, partial [Treponema sp.]|nr:pilus assembly protein PilZ [Treponema sp.]